MKAGQSMGQKPSYFNPAFLHNRVHNKNGGSGGARTRHKSNENAVEIAAPSQIASQILAELQEVASAWPSLTDPLKAAVLAIVRTAGANGVSHERD